MSIVVTTPTGNVGSSAVRALLEAGEKPVLIARDPSKVQAFVAQGATVKQGSHADAAFLKEATRGARALLVVTPPDMQMRDIRGHYRRYAEAAAEAIIANDIPRVVHLSSVGADVPSGNGPVAGLYVVEEVLKAACRGSLVQLRPGYFMENTLGQIGSILQAGALFTTFQPGVRFPMVATKDIGARAATALRDSAPGVRVVELMGPDCGYEEVAETLSSVLNRPLRHVTITPEQFVAALTQVGMSEVLAKSFNELVEGVSSGHVKFHEARSAQNTAKTSYRTFAEEVFLPAFQAATKH